MNKFIQWVRSIGSGEANTTGPGNYSKRPDFPHWSNPPPAPPPPQPKPMPPFDDEGLRNYDRITTYQIVKAIEFLRKDEGDSVTILCDNPDFNGQPNNAIECCCEWTEWLVMRFTGNTLLEALEAAVTAKKKTP